MKRPDAGAASLPWLGERLIQPNPSISTRGHERGVTARN